MVAEKDIKENKPEMPRFKSVEEEAKFWDTHSPLDFAGDLKEVKVKVKKPLIQMQVVSVRLDYDLIKQMKKIASRKHIGMTTLARMFIAEGVEKETGTKKAF
jgi:hypothetical protein